MASGKTESEGLHSKGTSVSITHCQQIFDQFPGRFNPQGAGSWTAVVQFNISGPKGGDWYVSIADGHCTVTQGRAENPTATVETSDDVYIGIATGAVNSMMAFSSGKVKVQGNMSDVMKLNNPDIFRRPVQ